MAGGIGIRTVSGIALPQRGRYRGAPRMPRRASSRRARSIFDGASVKLRVVPANKGFIAFSVEKFLQNGHNLKWDTGDIAGRSVMSRLYRSGANRDPP
jgi:hypothetical protein